MNAPVGVASSMRATATRSERDSAWLRFDSALLRTLGLHPTVRERVRELLDRELPASGARSLDAGCGRRSHLELFRGRIAELVGLDIHAPPDGASGFDRFVEGDVCTDSAAFAPGSFDVVLSSFTVEHLADPEAAFRNVYGWLRPGGALVLTTVNRNHPLVGAYLALSPRIRDLLQRFVKFTDADAHPIVGAANRPAELRAALASAGFTDIDLVMTPNLARAWGRRRVTFLLGLLGDLAAQRVPSRRSSIVASARRPRSA